MPARRNEKLGGSTDAAQIARGAADLEVAALCAERQGTFEEADTTGCGLILRFGFSNPVLIDSENTILAGHCRVAAARLLEVEQVPCLRLGNMSPAEKRAYVLADNKHALNAGWDE